MNKRIELSSIDYKEFKILTLCRNKEFVNINYLAEELKVTTRSIRTYIKQLNEKIGEDIAQIEYFKNKGYKLDVRDYETFKFILDDNMEVQFDFNVKDERVLYLLDFFIEYNDVITIDDLAEQICVGRTTIVNDIKSVKEILREYNLDLDKKQNLGIWLRGNEFDKRLLLLNHIYKDSKNNLYKSKYFMEEKIDVLKQSILSLFKEESFFVTDQIFEQIIKYILVQLYRIKNGNEIVVYDKRFDLLGAYDEYNISRKIKNIVEQVYDISLNEFEALYLTLPLVSGNVAPIYNLVSNKPKQKENIKELIKLILDEIYERMGIIISDEAFEAGLAYHIEFTLNRLLFNVKLKNLLLDDMKGNYTLSYNLAKIASEVIEKVYNLSVPEDEIGYIAIHFGSYLENNMVSNMLKKVAIVSSSGLATVKLLTIRIRKIIGQTIPIDTFSIFEIDNVDFSEYDLIFITSNVDINSDSVLIMDNILEEGKLRNKIEKTLYLKNSNLGSKFKNKKLSGNLLMGEFLKDTDFRVTSKKTVPSALKEMIDDMIEKGLVGEKFKNAILEREKSRPTAFSTGLLLPHSVNDISDELHISIAVLKNPIEYAGTTVKVIMIVVFSGDESDSDLLVKIYEEALSIGKNEKYINELAKCKTFLELKRVLSSITIK